MMAMFRWSPAVLWTLILILSGCGDAGPERVPVEGRLTFNDGRPVFPGSIAFFPLDSGTHQASTLLHEEGRFRMRTYPYGDGVVPGKYKVVLSLGMGSPPELAAYGSARTSPLEVTVPDSGLEDLQLALDSPSQTSARRGGPPGMRR